jgi:hypothetical protein
MHALFLSAVTQLQTTQKEIKCCNSAHSHLYHLYVCNAVLPGSITFLKAGACFLLHSTELLHVIVDPKIFKRSAVNMKYETNEQVLPLGLNEEGLRDLYMSTSVVKMAKCWWLRLFRHVLGMGEGK